MTTTNMPGYTADASLYKMTGFGRATITLSQDTAESVQPAMRASCVILDRLLANSIVYGNPYQQAFFTGAMLGAGCFG